jgi:hypothetical protein
MHRHLDDYPPAPRLRVEDAEKLFPYRTMSPDEYAAREAHHWLFFGFGEFVYADPALNEWIHTLDDILAAPGRVEAARRKYLTAEEIAEIERQSRDWRDS